MCKATTKKQNKNEAKLTVKQNLQTCIIGDNKDHNDSKQNQKAIQNIRKKLCT